MYIFACQSHELIIIYQFASIKHSKNKIKKRSVDGSSSSDENATPHKRRTSLGIALKEISTLFREGRINKDERKERINKARANRKVSVVVPLSLGHRSSRSSSGGSNGNLFGDDSPLSLPSIEPTTPLSSSASSPSGTVSSLASPFEREFNSESSLRPKSYSHTAVFPTIN
jgi:hypothetical protein